MLRSQPIDSLKEDMLGLLDGTVQVRDSPKSRCSLRRRKPVVYKCVSVLDLKTGVVSQGRYFSYM